MSTYEEEGRRSGSGSGKTVLLIVAIVAIVLLLVLGGCGALVYVVASKFSQVMSTAMQVVADMQAAMVVSQKFVDDLGGGRVDEAYAETSADYQAKTTKEALKALVDKTPALKKYASHFVTNQNVTPNRCTFTCVVNGQDGSTTNCTVAVVKENDGKWKVDRFTIP